MGECFEKGIVNWLSRERLSRQSETPDRLSKGGRQWARLFVCHNVFSRINYNKTRGTHIMFRYGYYYRAAGGNIDVNAAGTEKTSQKPCILMAAKVTRTRPQTRCGGAREDK